MKLAPIEVLTVHYAPRVDQRQRVGRLAIKDRRILFEYDAAFLASRLELSPMRLPLRPGVIIGDPSVFGGLMGVFDDSLPDGWGRVLLDRRIAQEGLAPTDFTPLDRLAWVGARAMGALTYEPDRGGETPTVVDLHALEEEARQVFVGDGAVDLERLIMLGGSPQGARPKALVQIGDDPDVVLFGAAALRPGYTPYLVKLRAPTDDPHAGLLEHAYNKMASAAGLDVPETRMLGRARGRAGYFAIRRFDRDGPRRIHLHTLCGLLHAQHTLPSVTYGGLLSATRRLTRDESMVAEMFRRACFNVFAHNRDDHTKNFSFLMDETGSWRVSPAYDLTLSAGPGGEHALLVGTEGRNPTEEHLRSLAREHDIKRAGAIVEAVRAGVGRFGAIADEVGLPKKVRDRVAKILGVPAPGVRAKRASKPRSTP